MTDEQKEAEMADMYETKKPEEGEKIPVDLIQDLNKDQETCIQKNYYEAERCYQPRLTQAQRNKKEMEKNM